MKLDTINESSEVFAAGHAESADWKIAADECLQQMGNISPDSNLGFLYITNQLANSVPEILKYFQDETGIAHWTGTVGYGICASSKEYYEVPAMSVLAGAFPDDSFRMLPAMSEPGVVPAQLSDWLNPDQACFGIVHGDPHNAAVSDIVDSLTQQLPNSFLVGGLCSAENQGVLIADQVSSGSLSGVLFSDSVSVVTAHTQGCTPIAKKHTVTECHQNVLVSLDNRPALEVFYEDIGEILAKDPQRIAGYIFAGLMIEGSDTSDYLVRNLVGIDEEKKLLAIGDLLEEGQVLQFCRRDGSTAWQDLSRMLEDLKRRMPCSPKGAVYYSCLGRGKQLFGDESNELREIGKVLGDVPLVGFFANGEISHNRLYGYTGVLTLFL